MHDVIVVGGGVIGLSIAFDLAGQGVAAAVLDQGDFGREASWAGAGILPPGNLELAQSPEAQLRALSHSRWTDWANTLQSETGIDTGYRRCGGIEVRFPADRDDLTAEVRSWRDEGVSAEELSGAELRRIEPHVSHDVSAAYRLPDEGQVRNPRLLKALVAGCEKRGVRLFPGTPVVGFQQREGHVTGVETPGGVMRGGRYCVAGGPWSRSILSPLRVNLSVEPVRGQIVLLSQIPRLFSHVLQLGSRYIVPRDDGRVLIGSTEEHVGFLKANTATAVNELLAFGSQIVPELGAARFERAWSGLRPGSADGLPYLGHVPACDNLFIAAGHFRSGLQMSAGTARVMCQALLEQETDIDLEPFAVDRARKIRRDEVPATLRQEAGHSVKNETKQIR
jgi:glycine oxidase